MNSLDYQPKSPFQIGKCLARIARYAGDSPKFYTVFQHSLIVAELLPAHLQCHGLIHDLSEAWTSDLPSIYKHDEFRKVEHELLKSFYQEQHLVLPTPAEHDLIKTADTRALIGEIYSGAGKTSLRAVFLDRDFEAEQLTQQVIDNWPVERLISTDDAAYQFDLLFRQYKL